MTVDELRQFAKLCNEILDILTTLAIKGTKNSSEIL